MVQGKKATQTHITQTEILKEQTLLPEYFAAEFVTFCGRETICSASYLDDIDFHVEFYSMRISKIHYILCDHFTLARNKNIAFYASNAFLHLNLPRASGMKWILKHGPDGIQLHWGFFKNLLILIY